tara:strand:- start:216 stop:836 length:621 start_codon:yes stop_codon:yes gene_type:complete
MRIVESNAKLRALMNKLLAKEGDKALKNASRRIKRRVQSVVLSAISTCDEIQELSNAQGVLRLDFGLDDDPTFAIIDAVVDSVFVQVKKITSSGNTFRGGLTIGIQPEGYANILSLPEGHQTLKDGGSLPWLSWLITRGDAIIIENYGVEYGSGFGRTGGAKMSKNKAPFRVNPQYAGDLQSNFITRALAPHGAEISKIVKEEISR